MTAVDPTWVNGDDFTQVSPHLTRALGGDLAAAATLARIRFRTRLYGYDRDGRRWWRVSADDLAEDLGLSCKQVRRALGVLERAGMIERAEHNQAGAWDHTLSYAIVYASPTGNTDVPKRADRSAPQGGSDVPKRADLPIRSEEEEKKNLSSDASGADVAARPDVERLCQQLSGHLTAAGVRHNVTQGWRDAARRLLDRDGRDLDEALALVDWCQADPFWRSNVLSMPTFRKQYDRLRLKAQARGRSRQDEVLAGELASAAAAQESGAWDWGQRAIGQ